MGQRRVEVDERTRVWLVESQAALDLVSGLEDPGACQRLRGFLCFGDRDELAVGIITEFRSGRTMPLPLRGW
jgi:hypothetical protein